jgi:Protein of unknown function (DUF2992)
MRRGNMKLTVFFNGQFWEGVVELCDANFFAAGRHVFGAEPRDSEVLDFVVSNEALNLLKQANAADKGAELLPKRVNPKRMARQVSKEMAVQGVSTMAQDAMRLAQEQYKTESKKRSKVTKEAEEEEKRSRARQKAKARHRGKA